jgi:hypothetical protein
MPEGMKEGIKPCWYKSMIIAALEASRKPELQKQAYWARWTIERLSKSGPSPELEEAEKQLAFALECMRPVDEAIAYISSLPDPTWTEIKTRKMLD